MTEERLIKNITDQIQELQIKLGYAKETVRLYYPLASLNALLNVKETDEDEMISLLETNEKIKSSKAGPFQFAQSKGRIEVSVAPEGVAYVHEHMPKPQFLKDMIELFQMHHICDIEMVCALFAKYSSDYVCEKMAEGMDFDYVIYFKDSQIDEYYYCIKEEMGHTIYHRFTKEDYFALLD